MFKIKYSHLMSFQFGSAMQTLANTKLPQQTAYKIKKIGDELTKARKTVQEAYQRDIIDAYAQRDENGEIKRPEGQPEGFFAIEEKKEQFVKDQDSFGDREIEVKRKPLHLADLASIQLTAAELSVLEPIYTEEAPEEAGPNVVSMK